MPKALFFVTSNKTLRESTSEASPRVAQPASVSQVGRDMYLHISSILEKYNCAFWTKKGDVPSGDGAVVDLVPWISNSSCPIKRMVNHVGTTLPTILHPLLTGFSHSCKFSPTPFLSFLASAFLPIFNFPLFLSTLPTAWKKTGELSNGRERWDAFSSERGPQLERKTGPMEERV